MLELEERISHCDEKNVGEWSPVGKSSVAIFRRITLKPDLKLENRKERKSI